MEVATSDFSNWVTELDSFQTSTTLPALSARSSVRSIGNVTSRKSKSQVEELRQEMKLLQWHKLANEAALKAALIKTKKLKQEDAHLLRKADAEERAEWMQQIIEEEQSKPMEVTSDFIQKYQEDERREDNRKDAEVQKHIESLQNLKKLLKHREDMRQRQMRYREGMATLKNKKSLNQLEDEVNEQQLSVKVADSTKGTLSNVIQSLDKLVDLEKRITDLENDNFEIPKSSSSSIVTSTKGRSRIKFTKKRTETAPNAPSKTLYKVTRSTRAKSKTFMTSVPEKRRASTRRMTDRQKRTVARLDKTKALRKETKRQDTVINDWLAKKKKKTTTIRKQPVTVVSRGAASGRTSGNRHMQEFNSIKRNLEKRKDKMAKPVRRHQPVIRRTGEKKPAWGGGGARQRTLPTVRSSRTVSKSRRIIPKKTETLPSIRKRTTEPGIGLSMGITGRTLR